jgi:hypothetical protein
MKARIFLCGLLLVSGVFVSSEYSLAARRAKPISDKKFDALAAQALEAMKQKASELNIQGVAVVSYAGGDSVQGWSSKMAVVGRLTDPNASVNGNNLLGIAYAKSAEMARTLQDSGTVKGSPMTGEFGWQGGVVFKTSSGYVIVAFSGGKSEDDVQVSKAGLEVMKKGLS